MNHRTELACYQGAVDMAIERPAAAINAALPVGTPVIVTGFGGWVRFRGAVAFETQTDKVKVRSYTGRPKIHHCHHSEV